MKFAIQPGLSSREVIAVMNSARRLGHEYEVWPGRPDPYYIPIGDVDYCESAITPSYRQKWEDYPLDFYPDFLRHMLHRKVGYGAFGFYHGSDYSPLRRRDVFLKPAKRWKSSFSSRVVKWDDDVPVDWYYWSEPVKFVQEWRYYVEDGRVVTTGWYQGEDEDEPAPSSSVLDIRWPAFYSAAVDFGRLEDGRIALVEAHAPYACGWYGENHDDYVRWQAAAWNRFLSNGELFRRKDLGRF